MPVGEVRGERHGEINRHDVVVLLLGGDVAVPNTRDLSAVVHEPFGDQEARRQLEVVARRAHCDGDAHRLLAQSAYLDRQRLLRGEPVRPLEACACCACREYSCRGRSATDRLGSRRPHWRPEGLRCRLAHEQKFNQREPPLGSGIVGLTMRDWLDRYASELGLEPMSDEEIEDLLASGGHGGTRL